MTPESNQIRISIPDNAIRFCRIETARRDDVPSVTPLCFNSILPTLTGENNSYDSISFAYNDCLPLNEVKFSPVSALNNLLKCAVSVYPRS